MPPYNLPDWNALLAGIVAHADADLPRLVAADWLEENGDAERAAFIRLQCEREYDDAVELKWAEERFRNSPTGIPLWAAEACPSLVGPDFTSGIGLLAPYTGAEKITFRRGFPFRITCVAAEWQRYGAFAVPRQPVRELILRECRDPNLDWWAMFATLRHLETVALDDGDYPLLRFLRRELPGVDVIRYSATSAVAAAVEAAPLPVAPPPRLVSPPPAVPLSRPAADSTG
jgi:uncharacterized protein (TIGR02996 family)